MGPGFLLLVGVDPLGYTPRIPMLFHPPEGARVFTPYQNTTKHPETPCTHCERLFVAVDPEGTKISAMCCSLRCSKKMRGIQDPPPRVIASFNRWHPAAASKDEASSPPSEVQQDG